MKTISMEIQEGIAVLQIKRPETLNALSREVVDEIDDAIETLKAAGNTRVLILYSEKNFAAGADIKEMVSCTKEDALNFSFSVTFNKIANLSIPTIAAIEGYALGGGLELALTCDLRIASSNAKLGFPETGLGIMPGAGGTIRAPRIIGETKAMEMILLGTIMNAEEAMRIGLVNRVVDPLELMNTAMKWADRLAKGAPIALAAAKRTIKNGLAEKDIASAIVLEGKEWAALFETQDQKEGMQAFIEKRKPDYQGK